MGQIEFPPMGFNAIQRFEAELLRLLNPFYMTKNNFRKLCAEHNVTCRYSGCEKTFFVSGSDENITLVTATATGSKFKIIPDNDMYKC